jgi:hypothetical protein
MRRGFVRCHLCRQRIHRDATVRSRFTGRFYCTGREAEKRCTARQKSELAWRISHYTNDQGSLL